MLDSINKMANMQNIASGLVRLKPKTVAMIGAPTLTLPVPGAPQAIDPFAGLEGVPGIDVLRNTPGLAPYFHIDLIPDLLYLAQSGRLADAIARADPNDPGSIIFRDPTQDFHRETQKVEYSILTGDIDVQDSDIECINPKCKAKKVKGPLIKQRASADEPPYATFQCTKCRHIWSMKIGVISYQ